LYVSPENVAKTSISLAYEVGRQQAEILKRENPETAKWVSSASGISAMDAQHRCIYMVIC
jgi:hypothetical protein